MERLQPVWEAIGRFWKKKHITQFIMLLFLTIFLLILLYFVWTASRVNISSLKEGLSQPTVIYDKNGKIASNVLTNRTEGVTIEKLPKHVSDAVIAIEDERFREHRGFDIKGIARAFFHNLLSGSITGGGSTITQQLTKNALLSREKTYTRKVEELFLAIKIEKVYKKDEILQMYLNQVYFGSGSWGISQASKKYFNKDINDISISEAATLAALLQAPSALDPYKHYDRAMNRRNMVLDKMKEHHMITTEDYKKAKAEKIKLEDGGGSFIDRKYPYYVDAVLDEAIHTYGLTQEDILTRGYRIYTEMDQNLQTSLEKVYKRDSLFPRGRSGEIVQSGSVLLNPETGGVLALIGGRGDNVFRGFNRATHLKAQPGSTMKPLAVYTPALEEGYDPTSLLVDEPTTFGEYKPENFSKQYEGEVTMYAALEKSLNIPTVWLLDQIGLKKGIDSAKRFGIPIEKEDENLALALGGMHHGISPLQLAESYSTFPNGGKRRDSHLITKIIGPTGDVIAEHKTKTVKVTSKAVTKEMTSMLLNVVESGTGKGTRISGLQIAGKTGSTQLPYENINGTKDQWFVGYTPNLVGAIWLGYDKTDQEHYLPNSSSENVVPIFRAIMEQSKPFLKTEKFEVASIKERLNDDEQMDKSQKALEDQVAKFKKELKKNTSILEDKIKEESPKWKESFDKMMYDLGKTIDELIQKVKKPNKEIE
ncbi:PBP1A family penicillin-binding protein [Bacillus sp. CGMCC 1.16607]|uniref:PBP1A family penicillin-binding protein n=1 Tax=Bacillus sp. CGMCC 1.16607 TaxID=3351842 RepID=UPI00363B2583